MIGTVLSKMILYFGTDVRRIQHAMKVYCFAYSLWEEETLAEGFSDSDERRDTLFIAAILHDIGIHEAERKYNSSAGQFQEIEGPPIAERILNECAADSRLIARVCYLIGHHHTYNLIDDLDFQILVEADLLVNLEEDHIDRAAILSVREKFMKSAGAKKTLDSYLLPSG
jgi:HD superfamily phosphodiesterase